MKATRKKLRIFSIALILIIILGFLIQYQRFNSMLKKSKEKNIVGYNIDLRDRLNAELRHNSDYLRFLATFIDKVQWEREDAMEYFRNLADEDDIIRTIYFGTAAGEFIISDDLAPGKDFDPRERLWYVNALKEEDVVASPIYEDYKEGRDVVTLSKAVYTEERNLIGVLAADIKVEDITTIIEELSNDLLNYSFLIDGEGKVLAHKDHECKDCFDLEVLEDLSKENYKEFKENKSGNKAMKLNDVSGYIFYDSIENTDWTVVSFISKTDYSNSEEGLWTMFIITLVLAALIFITFTHFFKKYFINPTLSFYNDAKRIDIANNIGYRLPEYEEGPFHEIRELANEIIDNVEFLMLERKESTEEIISQKEELASLSYKDQLTNLYNRRYFEKKLIEVDREENLPISIIMADINGLKLINDSFGHDMGDELIKSVGNMISKGCRAEDTVFRISGDEFIMLLTHTSEEISHKVVSRIKNISQNTRLNKEELKDLELAVSFGVGTKESMKEDINQVVKKAEENMYHNKLDEGQAMRLKSIESMVNSLHRKNPKIKAYTDMALGYGEKFAQALELPKDKKEALEKTIFYQEIGRISMAKGSLNKHPAIGYRILSTVNEMLEISQYVLYHRENYDGSGYPKGLKGSEIPFISKIVRIVDFYVCLLMDSGEEKESRDTIIQELRENSGSKLDPSLVEIFIEKVIQA